MNNKSWCSTEAHSGALFLGTLQRRVYCCHSTLQRDIFPLSFQWAVNLTKRLQRATEWFYVLFRNYLLHFAVGPSLYYIVPIFFPFRFLITFFPWLAKVCDDRHSELIPCLDRNLIYQMRLKLDLSLMEHYERHCPPPERRFNCLIPPPPGYKVSFSFFYICWSWHVSWVHFLTLFSYVLGSHQVAQKQRRSLESEHSSYSPCSWEVWPELDGCQRRQNQFPWWWHSFSLWCW